MNNEIISLLKLINESDYENRPGYFIGDAAKIKFSFTSKDYSDSLKAYKKNRTVNKYLRVIIHEYFHFFQQFYTTYGYYNQLTKQFKIAITINIVKHLANSGYSIDRPIVDVIESNLELINDNYITKLFFNWIDADIVYSYINYDYYEYNKRHELAGKIRVDFPVVYGNFLTLERNLFEYIEFSSRIKNIPPDLFIFKSKRFESILEIETINATNKALNIFPSINGIIESYSKASELYIDRESYSFDALKRMIVPAEKFDYYVPLILASQFIHTNNFTEFLLTYLAICDISLAAPVLPNLVQLRTDDSSIDNIDPCYRFYLILHAQSNVRPIKNLHNDYDRYVNELCDLLNWATPRNIAEKIISTVELIDGDTESYLFVSSQEKRLISSHIFLDIETFLLYLADNLTHCPITELTDDVFVNHNINDEVNFTLEYLKRQYWLNVLFGTPNNSSKMPKKLPDKLYFPYRAEKSTIEIYSDMFCEIFKQFGINIKNIKIDNLPI